jgi:hypothetical protein
VPEKNQHDGHGENKEATQDDARCGNNDLRGIGRLYCSADYYLNQVCEQGSLRSPKVSPQISRITQIFTFRLRCARLDRLLIFDVTTSLENLRNLPLVF